MHSGAAFLLLLGVALAQPQAELKSRAENHYRQGQFEAAGAAFKAAYDAGPNSEIAYMVGICAIQLYKLKDAENWLMIATSDPKAKGAWFQALGKCLLDAGRPGAARDALSRALAIGPVQDPNYPIWFYNRGLCSLEIGDYETCAADFEECLKLKPTHAQAWFSLGLARSALNKSEGALQALRTAAQIDPTNVEALFLCGRTQLDLGQNEAAVTTLQQTLKLVSGHVGALWNLSRALQKLGRKEEAKACFQQFKALAALNERIEYTDTAVKINAANAPLRLELVKLLLEAGRARDAMQHLETLARTAPGSTVFFQMTKALRLLGARAEADRAEATAQQLLQQGR